MAVATRISTAALRYARALAELAEEAGAVDAVEQDLETLAAALTEAADFSRFIASPLFGGEVQRRVMDALLDALGAHDLTRRFIHTLIANRRLALLPEAIAAWRRLRAERRGELSVEAVTAAPMTAAQRKKLAAALKTALKREVDIVNSVNPDIIGGLVLRVGSRMVDASVRQRLNALKGVLKGV